MPKAKKQMSQPSACATAGRNNQKRRGEIGEAAFLAKASSMRFGVAKPWGDSDRYDFIVDVLGRLLRVQIKSAHCVSANAGGGTTFAATAIGATLTSPAKLISSSPTSCPKISGMSSRPPLSKP